MTLTVYKTDGTAKQSALSGDPPVGAIMAFGGTSPPADWLVCDGTAVSRFGYRDLFAALGTAWGAGDGSTTFNLPDLRGATIVGAGQGSGLTNRALAAKGGEERHVLLAAESGVNGSGSTGNDTPDHTHNLGYRGAISVTGGTWGALYVDGGNTLPGTGASARHAHPLTARNADASHENMPPFAVANWVIRAIAAGKAAGLIQAPIPRVTVLPPYPVDGQEVYLLPDAGASVLSHRRYNAALAVWEVIDSTVGTRISAEFTQASGSMAASAESGVLTFTHNLGVVPSVVVGHLEDGGYAHECGWRIQGRTATQIQIVFRNNGPNAASAILRFRLLY